MEFKGRSLDAWTAINKFIETALYNDVSRIDLQAMLVIQAALITVELKIPLNEAQDFFKQAYDAAIEELKT